MRSGPVLIVAPPGDAHALVVAARIEQRGHEALIWDSSRLPKSDRLSLHISKGGRCSPILESSAIGTLDLSTLRSIWWRRPLPATVPTTVSGDFSRAYCRSESEQLLGGVLSGLNVAIYNHPDAEDAAGRKAFQLKVATEVGLCVPRTVMTSSPEAALNFVSTAATTGVIFKPFRTPIGSACATQRLSPQHREMLELLNNAPVIFQDLVQPHIDVRATVINRRIFAVESRSERLDWRTDSAISWTRHDLPQKIQSHILELMKRLRLNLGHLDFRIDAEENYIFFEVNPSGQFLFLEVDDERVEVTAALAEFLITNNN